MVDASSLTRSETWPLIARISQFLASTGVKTYVVGGWIRDVLLDRRASDVDFAVSNDGLESASRVAGFFSGTFAVVDDVNRVGRAVLTKGQDGQLTLDFATYHGTIEDDLARRDFTIDAIAVDPSETSSPGRLIDPFDGATDLDRKLVMATGAGVFEDDPLRLLRAVRLSALLGFRIDDRTESMIRRDALLVSNASGERTREELGCLLSTPGSGRFLSYMDRLGLLRAIIPELDPMRGAEQPKEHFWNVLDHCFKTVEAFDYLVHEGDWKYADARGHAQWSSEIAAYFLAKIGAMTNRAALFRLASLLHDIAKPLTRTMEPGGKVRFLGHPQEGADMAAKILSRLRFSKRERRLVETTVRYHLRPTQMGWPEMPTRRAVYRFCRDTGEAATGVLFVSLADHLATRGPNLGLDGWKSHTKITGYVISWREGQREAPPRLIDGYDIMNFFGLKPGQRLGVMLDAVREAQASGEISTKQEALSLVEEMLADPTAGRPETEAR